MPLGNRYCIITAGGIGTRMGHDIPKQFLKVAGKPILIHTLEKAIGSNPKEIRVTLPNSWLSKGEALIQDFLPNTEIQCLEGGHTRFDSIKAALTSIQAETDQDLVAIHDAVRPIASTCLFERSFEEAYKHGSAVAAVQARDTIRQKEEHTSRVLDRNSIWLIQTPQTFQLKKIKKAYASVSGGGFTDDASVYELTEGPVKLIEGEPNNLKITTAEDLILAEALLRN